LIRYGDIKTPDPKILYEVLNNTSFVGAPFVKLQEFRNSCLVSLPIAERMSITMNEVFRLYVASYQYKEIWKEVSCSPKMTSRTNVN
jgi:hypothetical protein